MNKEIFILLIIFQLKHYFADYKWQNEYMLGKFKKKGWIIPLSCHCFVHSFLTFIISLTMVNFNVSIGLAIFDFIVHFIMDRIKASPDLLGKYKMLSKQEFIAISKYKTGSKWENHVKNELDSNKKFWECLGLDQMVHHLTHYVIIWSLV